MPEVVIRLLIYYYKNDCFRNYQAASVRDTEPNGPGSKVG